MHGLAQSIGSVMTGIGVYCADGSRPSGVTAVSTFNTTA
jgi:hypothetical protein